MKGKIITRQKCSICGEPLIWKPKKDGCFCENHPQVSATRFVVRFPGGIYQNFTNYYEAEDVLNHLRNEFKTRKDQFNPDDYKSTKPHSFLALAPEYLETKKKHANYKRIETIINRAADHFGLTNIRDILSRDISRYIYSLKKENGDDLKEKTRANRCSQLHDFWMWCYNQDIITLAEFPKFPKIKYKLGYRKITNWEIQELVISKIREMSYHINPKIWLAIDMLAMYTEIRPDDLRRVTEDSLNDEWLTIHTPTKKENEFKHVHLVKDHIDEWRSLQEKYPALPDMPFFRHIKGIGGARPNSVFGDKYLYKWWVKACKEVGLEGVDLYGGTKHTTATETAKFMGKDQARKATKLTNKASERYIQFDDDNIDIVTTIRKKKKADILPFKKPRKGNE